jgi:beta-aspartyl-peptidase (threonine type)
MRRLSTFLFVAAALLFTGCGSSSTSTSSSGSAGPILVIHGGAGTILKENITDEQEAAYHASLNAALDAGYAVLENDGTALDAIVAAVTLLENDSLFNAGRGVTLTAEGKAELDAAIMDGRDRNAGTTAGIQTVKNPVLLARSIMEDSPHVMLIGAGAEEWAELQGLELVENEYFVTHRRRQMYESIKARGLQGGDAALSAEERMGTVGAVALDVYGNLAAATSTGGMSNKRFGRVGDVPIIGAGTYADNETVAVSATGWGEYFIRTVVAHNMAAMMKYGNIPLQEAADRALEEVAELGGDGGVISVTRAGEIAFSFNSAGMYRGYINGAGERYTAIFKDE